jgi:hypothetical protein
LINVILSSFQQAIPRIEGLKKGDIKKEILKWRRKKSGRQERYNPEE